MLKHALETTIYRNEDDIVAVLVEGLGAFRRGQGMHVKDRPRKART